MSVRRTVLFSGRVQGVGFRYTAIRVAAGFSVTGSVRNLADGRVELIAEGAEEELDSFVDAVRGDMGRHITEVSVSESPATDAYRGFSIAY
ncbi:MAG: acylphosphatase [Planctomycetota bacterium]|jgi:acylphosphatase